MLGHIADPSVMDRSAGGTFLNYSRSGIAYISAPVSDKDRMVLDQFYMW